MPKAKLDDPDSLRRVLEALDGLETVEQQRVLRWAREKLGLPEEARAVAPPVASLSPATGPEELEHAPGSRPANIKTFIEAKKPSSDNQFAAAVAYFYRFEAAEHMRKETITKDDLLEACRQVGRNRLTRPDQTLVNAHGQGLLDRADKGAYSINTVGENLVAVALPSDGAVRVAGRRKPKKKTASPTKAATKTTSTKRAAAKKRSR